MSQHPWQPPVPPDYPIPMLAPEHLHSLSVPNAPLTCPTCLDGPNTLWWPNIPDIPNALVPHRNPQCPLMPLYPCCPLSLYTPCQPQCTPNTHTPLDGPKHPLHPLPDPQCFLDALIHLLAPEGIHFLPVPQCPSDNPLTPLHPC